MKRKEGGKPARGGVSRGRTPAEFADPYKKARRPRPAADDAPPRYARRPQFEGDAPPPYSRERRPLRREAGEGGTGGREYARREGGGFTVTLDPDVARVFRGDASVNKTLRLVLQMMQVVQGPPRTAAPRGERPTGERPRRGYQGSSEARGFTRKPRFDEEDEQ